MGGRSKSKTEPCPIFSRSGTLFCNCVNCCVCGLYSCPPIFIDAGVCVVNILLKLP